MALLDPDPRGEALLYLEWARAAAGRFLPGGPLVGGAGAVEAPASPPPKSAERPDLRPVTVSGAPAVAPPTSPADPEWVSLRDAALACRRCGLCETRTTVVFGEGSRSPRLLVVGEAPGAEEDASGRPFVGKAGQLLTKMLGAIGLAREDVFIANVLKCRPPGNRPPAPEEVAACRPYLEEQIRLLQPDLILLLGNHATKAVLGTDRGITSIRGRIVPSPSGTPALPTYHPSYLLRTPEAKRDAWLDLQLVAKTLGLAIPARGPREPAD